jgi:hypothetical protein
MKTTATAHSTSGPNWNKSQLVALKNPSGVVKIILTDGNHTKDNFSGIVLHANKKSIDDVGIYTTEWHKEYFELYSGEITLSN